MRTVTIVRLEESEEGALGSLLIDGKLFCTTLEPDANDPEKFQIPPGKYQCRRFHGWRWKNTFEILVEGHEALLFHAGNEELHTEGCILLGRQPSYLRGNRAILNSQQTFEHFLRKLEDVDEFTLYIYDFFQILKAKEEFQFKNINFKM